MIIENIQKLCTDRKIRWSAHSLARIQERGLSRNDVIDCILSGDIPNTNKVEKDLKTRKRG